MPTKEMKKLKENKALHDKEVKTFSNDLRKHNTKAKYDNVRVQSEDKANGLNYYNNLSESEKLVFQKELKKKEIRESYVKYLKYVFKDNYKLTRFHILLASICDNIVKRIEKGEKVRILLSIPPQHGKSVTCTETLPSWFIGRNPDKRCIVTAYNADIAEKFGDRNRQKVKDFGKELFGIEISDSQDNKTLWDIKNHLGGLYATGLLGSLTSNNGALIIVDDPFKNGEEADNPTIRDRVWETFRDSVMTRQAGSGNAIIVIHTRWHEDDLIGRILASEVSDEWVYVNIPCVWENGIDKLLHRRIGETLCPELGFDSGWANSQRKLLGARKWNALYQGKPFMEKGELLSIDNIKTYNKGTLPPSFEEITMSCDLNFGSKNAEDPTGIAIWGRVGGNHYLLEVVNKKISFTESLERVRFLCAKYPTMKRKIVEAKASGDALIDTLNNEIGGFVPYHPKMLSKVDRLKLCLPYFESGNVYFPNTTIDKESDNYIQQLIRFPKATHDEIVDITTQYLLNYQYKYGGKVNTDSKYSKIAKAIRGLSV